MKIVVHADEQARPAGPVAVQLPIDRLDPREMIGLVDCEKDQPLPVQTDTRGRMVWWCDALETGESRHYKMHAAGLLQDVPRIVVNENDQGATVRCDDQPVADYRLGQTNGRPELVLRFAGLQASVYSGWAQLNGVDYFSDQQPRGHRRHRRFTICGSGPVLGRMGMVVDWRDHQEQLVLTEHLSFVFYRAPHGAMIDMLVRIRAEAQRCTFEDTGTGGICTLACPQLVDAVVLNSEGGRGQAECWGQTANWCACIGQYQDQPIGLAVMDSPENMLHPTYWNAQDAGLVAANPFGLSTFLANKNVDGSRTWKAHDTAMFRYRIIVDRAACSYDHFNQQYQSWQCPVRVEVH